MKRFLIFCFLVFTYFTTFSQVKISDMPTFTGNPSGSYIPIVNAGTNKKFDLSNFVYTGTTYSDPSWIASLSYSKLIGAPTFLTTINGIVAAGDLYGTYPNPNVLWSNGYPTYDLRYMKPADVAAGYVPLSRTITINGVTYDLSANRSWTITSTGGSSTLAGLTDVNITSPSDGQILKFDFASGKWINITPTYLTTISGISVGGDLSGTLPNPSVVWANGYPTYDARYLLSSTQSDITWSVLDILNTPPSTPADGDTYLVGTAPTGLWSTYANQIVVWSATGSVWNNSAASSGDLLYNDDANLSGDLGNYKYNGTTWTLIGKGNLLVGGNKGISNLKAGTVDAKPFSLITNNTKRFSISAIGAYQFNTLTGTGNGFMGLDGSGNASWIARNTDNIAEGSTNKYYTDTRARAALSLSFSTTGSSGAATGSYNNATGVFTLNIPNYTLSGLGGEPSITAGTISQYWRGDKSWQTLNTDAVTEATNLYFTNARARASVSLTTTGSSGAATYSSSTGVLNIPNYTLSGLGGEPSITAGTISQYWRGDKSWQTLNTDAVTEATNLYFTNARARAAVSLNFTTTGTSGAATGSYNSSTGVFSINVPQYSGGGTPANPTASVGLTAVNGSATTYMRSDAAPALDQSITPNWTGGHLFSANVDLHSNVFMTGLAAGNSLNDSLVTINGNKIYKVPFPNASPFVRQQVPTMTNTLNVIQPRNLTDTVWFGSASGTTPTARYTFDGTSNFMGGMTNVGMTVNGSSTFNNPVSLLNSGTLSAFLASTSSMSGTISGNVSVGATQNAVINSGVIGAGSIGLNNNTASYANSVIAGLYGYISMTNNTSSGNSTATYAGVIGMASTMFNASTPINISGVMGQVQDIYGGSTVSCLRAYGFSRAAGFPNGSSSAVAEYDGVSIDSIYTARVSSGIPFGVMQKGTNMGNFFAGSVNIGYNGSSRTASASAILQVNSTTQGFLPPRMTTAQRTGISSPAEGLVVYDTDLHKLYCYDGTTWQAAW